MMPLLAALGASLLTIAGSFGLTQHQATLRRQEARARERAAAYGDLLSRSLEMMMRVRAVGEVMRLRSSRRQPGVQRLQGVGQFGFQGVLDWIGPAFQPFADAWSRVSAAGSRDAVNAGNDLVRAIYSLLSTAVSPAPECGWLLAFLDGRPWTGSQCSSYETAIHLVITYRGEFITVMRRELGAPPASSAHPPFRPPERRYPRGPGTISR
jgi:hypothetical protein